VSDQHSLMAGLVPASQITDHISNSRASSPVLFGEAPGRPVFPLSPLKEEGDGAPGGATIVLCMPASPLGNTGRLPARHPDSLRSPGLFAASSLRRRAALFVAARETRNGRRQPAPGGRLLLAARRSPGAARVRALRGTPAGAASCSTIRRL
jgi:hypothetical protein